MYFPWQPTPAFLPGKSHGQRSLAGYSPWGRKRVGHNLVTKQHVYSTVILLPSERRSVLGVHWKDWCWGWNSNTLATSCKGLTHWKRLWCWEELGAGGEEDNRGWDGWMASPTRWTWVWVNSGSWWWWTGRPGVLWFMGSQRVGHDWATKLNWILPLLTLLLLFCQFRNNWIKYHLSTWQITMQPLKCLQ